MKDKKDQLIKTTVERWLKKCIDLDAQNKSTSVAAVVRDRLARAYRPMARKLGLLEE